MSYPELVLKKPLREKIQRGHPWIYRSALKEGPDLSPGTFVTVTDREGFVAYGYYDPESTIAVRVLSTNEREVPDETFFQKKLLLARRVRETILPKEVEGFRWIHGEADGVGGIVLDRYKDIGVLRVDSPSAYAFLKKIFPVLKEESHKWGIHTLILRYSRRMAEKEGKGKILAGDTPPSPFWIREYDWKIEVDPIYGQKTGLFLDQRENRRRIYEIFSGEKVLNLFAYTGSFGIVCGKKGAKEIIQVEIAGRLKEVAERNLALNNLTSVNHRFYGKDVFQFFKEEGKDLRDYFDMVIVDPPSFAPNEKSVPKAKKAYLTLLKKSLSFAKEGGIVAFSSCSSHITQQDLLDLIPYAEEETKKRVLLLESRGAGPDHPVLPSFPEGRYLKFLILQVF